MSRSEFLKKLRDQLQEWNHIRGQRPERKREFRTRAGLPVEPLYTPADLESQDYIEAIGVPGKYPYTRAAYPDGYRSRGWQARQYCGFGTAEETNERLHFALRQGETGLNVIMDLPTSYHGVDADDPKVEGEVGKTGVSCNSIEDMKDLFDGIPIDRISVTFNTTGLVVPAMYFAMAEERGVALESLRGTALNNPLASYVSCNSGVLPAPGDALREIADVVEFTTARMPRWNPLSIGSYEYRENGATAVQELAFMLGNAIAYTDAFVGRGLDFDQIAPHYVFYTSVQTNLFEEVAKFRAGRRMWARIARERYRAKEPASMVFRIHTQTSGLTLTAEQPLNNIVRTTLQSLAAVLGGTNSLYTDPYDEALCLPSEEGLRTAMRVQQIILEESGVADTIDPLGGSYFAETLTNQMEEAAQQILDEIERRGGMVRAIEEGWVQAECERSIARYMDQVAAGDEVIVGHNRYRSEEEIAQGTFTVDPRFETKQRERLKKLRAERDERAVGEALTRLGQAAATGRNMMAPCIAAARARATFGEMTTTIYGEMEPFRDRFNDLKLRIFA